MRKTIIPIIFGIVLISLVSAMYAGDCLEVNLSELKSLDNVVYDVVGNESNLEGLTIDLNKTTAIVNICTVLNYKPDSFTILFIDNSTKEVVKEVYSGGSGGTRTRTITEYVDRYITNDTTDDPITCTYDECEKDVDENLYFWPVIIIGSITIAVLVYFVFKALIENKIKGNENGNKTE